MVGEKRIMLLRKVFQGLLVALATLVTVSVTANELVQVSAVGTYEYKSFKKTASRGTRFS